MEITILTIDFESFYTTEYSLKRMTPVEYALHPLWECIGAAVRMDKVTLPLAPPTLPKVFGSKAKWIEGPDLPRLFAKIDWTKTVVMSHNVGFDGSILFWRYGVSPMLYIDTLGMCRATMPEAKGASLEKVLDFIGAPPKGTALAQARNWRRQDLLNAPAFYAQYKLYAERDCDGCFWIFQHLAHWFAGTAGVGTIHRNEEFVMMDMVARMAIQPQFALDMPLLRNYLKQVVREKDRLLEQLTDSGVLDAGNPKRDLMSNEKFAVILRNLGIEPPRKRSPTTDEWVYAFAKTDEEFTDLLEDEDPTVQAVVAARLGHKTTLEETRTQRFINIGSVSWPADGGVKPDSACPPMPFPLKFSGAHTHRLSGDWSLNLQNLGRKSTLRAALIAPPGHVIVSADAAQIEARIVSWLAGCTALTDAFAAGLDNYAILASDVYGYVVDKKTHPGERFVGKTGVLGLGFGMGAPKFIVTCWNQGRNQGLAPELCRITDDLAQRTVNTYRRKYKEVPAYWKAQTGVIEALSQRRSMDLGVLKIDGPAQAVILPNGMRLFYHNMRQEVGKGFNGGPPRVQWMFDYGRRVKYTFGGKQTENVVQALSKIITMNAASRIRRITRFRTLNLGGQIHDQLAYVAPKEVATDLLAVVIEEMSRRLDWFSTLPLAAEGGIGANLLEIK